MLKLKNTSTFSFHLITGLSAMCVTLHSSWQLCFSSRLHQNLVCPSLTWKTPTAYRCATKGHDKTMLFDKLNDKNCQIKINFSKGHFSDELKRWRSFQKQRTVDTKRHESFPDPTEVDFVSNLNQPKTKPNCVSFLPEYNQISPLFCG